TSGVGVELWKLDGSGNPVLVKDINAGSGSSSPNQLFAFDGQLYFTADDGIRGREVWTSDGTTAGTVLVEDVNGRTGSSSPSNLIDVAGTLYFTASDGVVGVRLWRVDPTTGIPEVVVVPGEAASNPGAFFDQFTAVQGSLFFRDQANNRLITIDASTGDPVV
ncbi:ELWxxDGT repeat protein, partial [Synechococcus sp. CCY 0621]|uniref:ELWxxDGT repeat protein n=1 Tax=Synechococcus sp. CCY 0621 TaxID=2815603 RepID=UPI001C231DAA